MDNTMQQIAAIGVAMLGVAIVAVIVSKNAQTSTVIQSAGTAFSQILGVAVSPVAQSSNNPLGG
jgi:hypothetical protein